MISKSSLKGAEVYIVRWSHLPKNIFSDCVKRLYDISYRPF